MTFAKAVLDVGALRAPRIGSRIGVNLAAGIASLGRSDLFDEAVTVRTTPLPFQHKLHPHLRPHFVDSCQRMLGEGHHRETIWWIMPFIEATTDVLLVDGLVDRKQDVANTHTQAEFLQRLNVTGSAARDVK